MNLKTLFFFDKSTYKYYMLENNKMSLDFSKAEMIMYISNYIKLKYNKIIKIDEIQEIILVELSGNVGFDNSNPPSIKYFIIE